jgi:hypothetical protein
MGFWNPMLNDLAQSADTEAVSERLHSFISSGRVQSRTSDDVTIAITTRSSRSLKEEKQ